MAGLQECKTAAEVNALARAVNAKRMASRAARPSAPKPIPRPATLPVRQPAVVPTHPSPSWKCGTPRPKPEPEAPAPKPEPPPADPLYGVGRVTVHAVIRAVLRHYPAISQTDICSQRRTANIVRPRQIAMYLAKRLTLNSVPQVGRLFGGRDHTTVLHAVRKIEGERHDDAALNTELLAIELELNPPPSDDPNQMPLPFAGEGG